jgi:hypothetical protein
MRFLRAIGLGAVLALAALAPARAYSPQDRAACEPEMKRLCSAMDLAGALFGFYGGIEACIHRHYGEIALACRAVIDRERAAYQRRHGR